jgi:putative transposase
MRKRMRRHEVPAQSRFITFSCYRRLPLLGNPLIRDLFVRTMVTARLKFNIQLFAWVVMPEHAHLLVHPGANGRLAPALRSMKTSIAKQVIERWRTLQAPILREILTTQGRPRFWQTGGGFDRNVRDTSEFVREVRYIHRNPVERGLVAEPQHRAWSSVRWWMGRRGGEVECDPPPGDPRLWRNWTGYM